MIDVEKGGPGIDSLKKIGWCGTPSIDLLSSQSSAVLDSHC
jgi:hypothetical protein